MPWHNAHPRLASVILVLTAGHSPGISISGGQGRLV